MKIFKTISILLLAMPAYASHISVVIDNHIHKKHSPEGYFWQPYPGFIPRHAVLGGDNDRHNPLYICQASFQGGMHPGKLVADRCNITYGGQMIQATDFGVLVGKGLSWIPANPGMIPPGAVVGGVENGQPLFICQANFAGGNYPGKIVAGKCNIGYRGNEVVRVQYQVLVSNRVSGGQGYYPASGSQASYAVQPSSSASYAPASNSSASYGPSPSSSASYGPSPSSSASFGPSPSSSASYGPIPDSSASYGPPPSSQAGYGPASPNG